MLSALVCVGLEHNRHNLRASVRPTCVIYGFSISLLQYMFSLSVHDAIRSEGGSTHPPCILMGFPYAHLFPTDKHVHEGFVSVQPMDMWMEFFKGSYTREAYLWMPAWPPRTSPGDSPDVPQVTPQVTRRAK